MVEGVPGATDLRTYHRHVEGFPRRVGAIVGEVLARLHDGIDERSPTDAPRVLSLHRPTVQALGELTPESIKVLKIVQAEPGIGRELDRLRAGWSPRAPVHNDIKWDNVLIAVDDPSQGVRVVDWEHAGRGDPLWDAGSAIAGYLSAWLFSIDGRPGDDPDALPERATYPLEEMAPAISALWTAYLARRRKGADGDGDVERATRYAGARLLATVYEVTQAGSDINAHLVLHLQLGANLLQQPRVALARLGLAGARPGGA